MDIRVTLSKILTLIYRSRIVNNLENDDLIRTILATIKTDSPDFSFGNTNIPKVLKAFCIELLEDREAIPKEVILPKLSLLLEKDAKLMETMRESISPDYDDASNKRIIAAHIKHLYNYHKEHQATEILSKVSYDLKFGRSKIPNFAEYLKTTLTQLEPFTTLHTSIKDPGIVNEMDFESTESVTAVFEEIKNGNSDAGVYKTGWQAVNRMLQGGFRRGVCVGVEALQHKYKSSSTLSLMAQIAMHNKPLPTKEEVEAKKKPLILRISLEDPLRSNLQFFYQYLKATEGITIGKKELESMSAKQMAEYTVSKLTKTGFHIKMMRVDPNQWTYSSIMNKVIELEAQGYAVHMLMVDYLFKLPTTGCTQGALGADKRDLVRRMLNFCSARGILFMSPFQLSTEANQLLRNGVPDHQFLNEVAEKNYTDSCKTVGQELDLELYVHIFTHKRKSYLAFRRGKDRSTPTAIPEELKYCMYRFPNINTPVLPDIDGDDTSFTKLPKEYEGATDGLLDEILM